MAEDKLEIVSKYRLTIIGRSFKGRTTVSKTVNLGSNPSRPAKNMMVSYSSQKQIIAKKIPRAILE